MRALSLSILVLVLIAGMLFACGQSQSVSPAAETKTGGAKATAAASQAGWEQKWEATVAKGKAEGRVTIYGVWVPDTRNAVTRAFKDKYGIDVEFTLFGRGAELLARVQAEARAGLYLADVFGAGNTTLLVTMKPENVLGRIEPLLMLPEVSDPKAWRGGQLPFTDKEGMAMSLIGVVMRTNAYNTEMIKEGEITSYKDLLKPQYKGKITLNDPTVEGSGNAVLAHLGLNLWGEAGTIDFLKRLIVDQDVAIQRDSRLHVETVARGKYAFALAPFDVVYEFIAAGAPLKQAMVAEDNRITASTGGLGVPIKSAHPNATLVFINWLLGKEGQTIFARSLKNPSTRIDASTEGIDPSYIPEPGKTYYGESEEAIKAKGKWLEIAKKVMAENSK